MANDEQIVELKFFNDGSVSVEAFGYDEQIDTSLITGKIPDISALKDRYQCIEDVHDLMKSMGKIEELTLKDSETESERNLLHIK